MRRGSIGVLSVGLKEYRDKFPVPNVRRVGR